MRNLQEEYDDLWNIKDTLNDLINSIKSPQLKEYIEDLELIRIKAISDYEEVEKEIQKKEEEDMWEDDTEERKIEYRKMQGF